MKILKSGKTFPQELEMLQLQGMVTQWCAITTTSSFSEAKEREDTFLETFGFTTSLDKTGFR
jgi:hypothetical protein